MVHARRPIGWSIKMPHQDGSRGKSVGLFVFGLVFFKCAVRVGKAGEGPGRGRGRDCRGEVKPEPRTPRDLSKGRLLLCQPMCTVSMHWNAASELNRYTFLSTAELPRNTSTQLNRTVCWRRSGRSVPSNGLADIFALNQQLSCVSGAMHWCVLLFSKRIFDTSMVFTHDTSCHTMFGLNTSVESDLSKVFRFFKKISFLVPRYLGGQIPPP